MSDDWVVQRVTGMSNENDGVECANKLFINRGRKRERKRHRETKGREAIGEQGMRINFTHKFA